MNDGNRVRQMLRQWLAERSSQLSADEIHDDFPILKERVITSLQVTDLLLFIESLRGTPVTIQEINPSAFGTINEIYDTFLKEAKICV